MVVLEGPCRTTKHFQKPQSFSRNIRTFPVSSLFVSWGERLVRFVTSFLIFFFYRISGWVMWRQRNLKFACEIYLFIYCTLYCGGGCSTVEIKKSFLNQLITRKIKNFIRKETPKTKPKPTENLAKKCVSMKALSNCIPDCVTLIQGRNGVLFFRCSRDLSHLLRKCHPMEVLENEDTSPLGLAQHPQGVPGGSERGAVMRDFHLSPHWFALFSSEVYCYKKKLFNLILFMKSGAGANQWFQWCFYFI